MSFIELCNTIVICNTLHLLCELLLLLRTKHIDLVKFLHIYFLTYIWFLLLHDEQRFSIWIFSNEASPDLLFSFLFAAGKTSLSGHTILHLSIVFNRVASTTHIQRRINNIAADIMDRTAGGPAPREACWERVPPPSLSPACTRRPVNDGVQAVEQWLGGVGTAASSDRPPDG